MENDYFEKVLLSAIIDGAVRACRRAVRKLVYRGKEFYVTYSDGCIADNLEWILRRRENCGVLPVTVTVF